MFFDLAASGVTRVLPETNIISSNPLYVSMDILDDKGHGKSCDVTKTGKEQARFLLIVFISYKIS